VTTPSAFIQARNYTPCPGGREVKLVVIHTMESPEKPGTAMAVAKWFAGSSAPQASAHYCCDATEIVQCVAELDIAWGAPGANRQGIHIEHAGKASQNAADWDDEPSRAMLALSAQCVAGICTRWDIPIVRPSIADLAAGAKGIVGHWDVTRAFPAAKGSHTDPGVHFPWFEYLENVLTAAHSAKLTAT
jgi:N-acetyl-anhydromuramyl-L-alanine amidase AmpD